MHPLLVRLSVLSIAIAFTSHTINSIVPEPYLDEVFHIPQAQAYCRNAFSVWDPKLTTPAGLYLLSYPLSYLGACTPSALRAVNAFGIALLPVIIFRIQQILHGKGRGRDDEVSAQTALNVALFPLLFFFGGLYYTDVWSTIFVLAAYLATLKGSPWIAAVYCWVALWFRQTNVVWVVFMAGVSGARRLRELQQEERGATEKKKGAKQRELGDQLLDLRQWSSIEIHDPLLTNSTTLTDFLITPFTLLPAAIVHLAPFLGSVIAYTIPLNSFVLFLIINNYTIVLGDASAHVASLHLSQLLYFAAFTAFFSFPLFFPIILTLRLSTQKAAALLAVAGVMAAVVKYNTILHPYLLADNRHYAFYVFRRILLRLPPYSLLAPIPAYILAGWLQLRALTNTPPTTTTAWLILYAGATAATLVGAPLVEPRYFIIAWVIWRCHVREARMTWLLAEMVWFAVVNMGTLSMFLYKDFEWAHERGVRQRFMW